ncbi:MAG TPA: NAD-dependent DNA ligase LigA [Buchnera sp. (in: enterobacteria)]|nr:NAD-dependent DNA ligase LigA [Buchnera sp. (in: enterobacteria)]
MKNIKKKIKKIEKRICYHSYLYHTLDKPKISDLEFDFLVEKLDKLKKKVGLKKDILNLNKIGSSLSKELKTVKHLTNMLSLKSVNSIQQLERFFDKVDFCSKKNNLEKPLFCCELKLDGVALNLVYKNGKLVSAATRGNGIIGENVIHNVYMINSIPNELTGKNIPKLLEIRGEVIIYKDDFIKLNKDFSNKKIQHFSNTRNTAAGFLRQLNPMTTKIRKLSFYCHSIGFHTPIVKFSNSHFCFLKLLGSWGLPVYKLRKLCSSIEEVLSFYKKIKKDRSSLKFDIDGIVIKTDAISLQKKLGISSRFPKWSIAYKFPSKKQITKIVDINFNVSRTGSIIPVAQLCPVFINGVKIKKVSLYNQNKMEKFGFCIGDVVTICRSGDVIPKIIDINMEYRTKNNLKPVKFPKNCPSCKSKIKKNSGDNILRCFSGFQCISQRERMLIHFFSKDSIYIRGFGKNVIKQLVKKKVIFNPVDVFNLNYYSFSNINRFGDILIKKLLNEISNSKEIKLSCFLYSFGIKDVGKIISINLSSYFKNIDNILNAKLEDLLLVKKVGKKIANNFLNYITKKKNIEIIHSLLKIFKINSD